MAASGVTPVGRGWRSDRVLATTTGADISVFRHGCVGRYRRRGALPSAAPDSSASRRYGGLHRFKHTYV